jgi:hypothetical protein
MKDKVQEQALGAVRRSRPEDYDGHTEFDRMSPAQRLAWLDEATLFVWKQKARASRAEKIGKLK